MSAETPMIWQPIPVEDVAGLLIAGTHEVTTIEDAAFAAPYGKNEYVDPNMVFIEAQAYKSFADAFPASAHARTPAEFYGAAEAYITESLRPHVQHSLLLFRQG